MMIGEQAFFYETQEPPMMGGFLLPKKNTLRIISLHYFTPRIE